MTEFTEAQQQYRQLSNEEWRDTLLEHADGNPTSVPLPPMPRQAIQKLTNNISGRKSMNGAYTIYKIVREEMSELLAADEPRHFLDIGGGWGRITRYMTRDIPMSNLAACDVDERLVTAGRECMPEVDWQQIVAGEPLPYADNSFSAVLANSVLSHLDEEMHMHTVNEVARVLRPNGIFFGTTLSERHLVGYKEGRQNEWLTGIVGDLDEAVANLQAGQFIYGHTHRWDHYGVTFLPEGWVAANWAPGMQLAKVRTDYTQDVHIGRKP